VDFIGAFLNSYIKELIYMLIPQGFAELIEQNPQLASLARKFSYKASKNQVIILRKSLYSLKQSSKE